MDPIKPPQKPKISPQRRLDSSERIVVGEDIESVVEALYGEKREKIPEAVDYFIREAPTGIPGNWHNAANAFLFVLGLQGVEFDTIAQVFEELAPEPLDRHDEYLLDRSVQDGYNVREEEL